MTQIKDIDGKVLYEGEGTLKGVLEKAVSEGVCLTRAKLWKTYNQDRNLQYINLRGAVLTGADFTESDLRGAILDEANLTGAIFKEVDLTGAYLQRTILEGSKFWRAYLKEASLTGANLYRADFFGANLTGADFFGARSLEYAIFTGAYIDSGVDLTGCDLLKYVLCQQTVLQNLEASIESGDLRAAKLFMRELAGRYKETSESP